MDRRNKHGDKPAARSSQSRETPQEKRQRIERIFGLLEEAYSDARLALRFETPLELLIALILAAQCTDQRVNQVTAGLFRKYRTPQDWTAVDRATLETEIRSTGFYRSKAKIIQTCCAELVTRFGGKVPQKLDDLLALPGVGRKTANILRGNAFEVPAIGVDTHVGRLAQRLDLSRHTDPDKIEFDLNPIVPDPLKVRFCHLLQAHGRTICLSRKPNCPVCVVNHLCPYPRQANILLGTKT